MAEDFEVTGGLPEDDENRTFVIAAAGLGGLIVLSLVCLGVYAFILQPRQREAALQEPTSCSNGDRYSGVNAGGLAANRRINCRSILLMSTEFALTETAEFALAETAEAEDFTPVPAETATPTATDTPVPTDTPTATTLPTVAPLTATAAAQMTQTAEAIARGAGSRKPTPTALPSAGFGDDVGLPGLAGLTALFLVVIFLSRKLRSRTTPAG